MDQEYDNWNNLKKGISKSNRVFFGKGDVWFLSMGKNVGDEEDGKNQNFERPVLITRKFNNNIFMGVPLTSQSKTGKYYFTLESFPSSTAILSQVRLFDAKRLLRFIGKVKGEELNKLKEKLRLIV